jgi:hypothetical protein
MKYKNVSVFQNLSKFNHKTKDTTEFDSDSDVGLSETDSDNDKSLHDTEGDQSGTCSDESEDSETDNCLSKEDLYEKDLDYCQVFSKILPNKGQMCKNPVKFHGVYYCKEHVKYATHEQEFFDNFLIWFQYDPTIQFEVLPEYIKKQLYNYYLLKCDQLSRVLQNRNLFFYVSKTKTSTPFKEYWFSKKKKSKHLSKDKINRLNFFYCVSDILISKNLYRKYRKLTKEFRSKHGIKDITYQEWKAPNKN